MMPNALAPHSSSPGTNLTHIARVSTEVYIVIPVGEIELVLVYPSFSGSVGVDTGLWFCFEATARNRQSSAAADQFQLVIMIPPPLSLSPV